MKILAWSGLDFQEVSRCLATHIDPSSLWGILNGSAEFLTDEYLGSIESSAAAVSSVQNLNLGNGNYCTKLGLPPWSGFIVHSMDTGEFSLAPIGIEVGSFEWVPWLHPCVLPHGTHGDPVIFNC